MLRQFFLDKFEYDHQVNRTWSDHVKLYEDSVNTFILNQLSHIINVHHIWLSRLTSNKPESDIWDMHPSIYWDRLLQDNFRNTELYLKHFGEETKINFHDSEGVPITKTDVDILYHILNHSQYHRAQIARELRILDLPVPTASFIRYR